MSFTAVAYGDAVACALDQRLEWHHLKMVGSHDPLSNGHAGPETLHIAYQVDPSGVEDSANGILQIMEERRFDVSPHHPRPSECGVSYVVIYHGPAEDPVAFVDHYIEFHVATMARFSQLEAMSIYTADRSYGSAGAGDLLICHLGFPSIAALNAALSSDIRRELREGAQAFPPFQGAVVHQAMERYRR